MPARSLLTLATLACIKDVDNILDVGDLAWDLGRHFLSHVKDPKQLKSIEDKSPHIADSSARLWKAFIDRDTKHPSLRKQIGQTQPRNPRSWHKLYFKIMRQQKQLDAQDAELLEQQMQAVKDNTKAAKGAPSQYVNQVIIQPKRPWVAASTSGGSRKTPALKNAKKGEHFAAIRKEAYDNKRPCGPFGGPPNVTTTKITKAPASMLAQYKAPPAQHPLSVEQSRARQQQRKPSSFPSSFKVHSLGAREDALAKNVDNAVRDDNAKRAMDMKAKEDRLRALACGKPAGSPSKTASPAKATSPPAAVAPAKTVLPPRAASPLKPTTTTKSASPLKSTSTFKAASPSTAASTPRTAPSPAATTTTQATTPSNAASPPPTALSPEAASSPEPTKPRKPRSILKAVSPRSNPDKAISAPSPPKVEFAPLPPPREAWTPPPPPQAMKKRPPPSIFMPSKKRKV